MRLPCVAVCTFKEGLGGANRAHKEASMHSSLDEVPLERVSASILHWLGTHQMNPCVAEAITEARPLERCPAWASTERDRHAQQPGQGAFGGPPSTLHGM